MQPIETRYKGYRFRGRALPTTPQKIISDRANLTGCRFGRLRAVDDLGIADGGYRWWGCACDCGELVAVRSRELLRAHTKSCGCLQRESQARSGGQNRMPYGHASRNELLASYKKSAAVRGLCWELTDAEFFNMVTRPCTYCHTPASMVRKPNKGVNGEFVYSGLDRINSEVGYKLGNVVPCCWICNRAKGAMSLVEFEAWMDRLVSARFEHGENNG